jgi:hypothetical protein
MAVEGPKSREEAVWVATHLPTGCYIHDRNQQPGSSLLEPSSIGQLGKRGPGSLAAVSAAGRREARASPHPPPYRLACWRLASACPPCHLQLQMLASRCLPHCLAPPTTLPPGLLALAGVLLASLATACDQCLRGLG